MPVLFDAADTHCVPEPVRGHRFHVLTSEQAYEALYDFLLDQAGFEPGPVGEPRHKARPRAEPLAFPDVRGGPADSPLNAASPASPRVELTKLPAGASDLLGRDAELKILDDAWFSAVDLHDGS